MIFLYTRIVAENGTYDKKAIPLWINALLHNLHTCISQQDYALALKITKDFADHWPERKKVHFSIQRFQRLTGTNISDAYPLLLPLLQQKSQHFFARQTLCIHSELLARFKSVFEAGAYIGKQLTQSLKYFQTDLNTLRAMVQLSPYDYNVILQLPEDMRNLTTKIRSFINLNKRPEKGVSQKGNALVFAHGVNAIQAEELREAFDKRPELQPYLDTFIKTYLDQDPRKLSVKRDFHNVLTGMQLYHDSIIALIQKHLVSIPLTQVISAYGLSIRVIGPNGSLHFYNYSEMFDHNDHILKQLGDVDTFTYYARKMFELWLADYKHNCAQTDTPVCFFESVTVKEKHKRLNNYYVQYLPDQDVFVVSGGELSQERIVRNSGFSEMRIAHPAIIKLEAAAARLKEQYSLPLTLHQGQKYFEAMVAEAKRVCDILPKIEG